MSTYGNYSSSIPVVEMDAQSRGRFISRTYNHLFSAIVAFTLIEVALFKSGMAEPMAKAMLGTSWLLVLGGFVVVSWLARSIAHRAETKALQYAALAGYVVAEVIIFVPLLYVADTFAPGAISSVTPSVAGSSNQIGSPSGSRTIAVMSTQLFSCVKSG